MKQPDPIPLLNELIETSKDGEDGFRACAEAVQTPELKRVLIEYAGDCSRAAGELQSTVQALGGKPEAGGSIAGAAHRGWLHLKSGTTGRDEAAILEECERGEDYAKARYGKALQAELPEDIRTLLQRQYHGVLKHHNQIRDLRDRYSTRH